MAEATQPLQPSEAGQVPSEGHAQASFDQRRLIIAKFPATDSGPDIPGLEAIEKAELLKEPIPTQAQIGRAQGFLDLLQLTNFPENLERPWKVLRRLAQIAGIKQHVE